MKRTFWITLILCLAGLSLVGCFPDDPPVARRNGGNVSAGSIDTPAHGTDGKYQNGLSRLDGGSTGSPRAGYWITSEYPVGGMKVDTEVIFGSLNIPPGGGTVTASTDGKAYMNEKGYAIDYVTGESSSTLGAPYY